MGYGKSTLVSAGKKSVVSKNVKKAAFKATDKVDKYQNTAIEALNRKVNKIAKLPELKYFSVNTGVITATTSPQWFLGISKDIQNGTGDNNRIGDNVIAKYLHLKGTITMGSLLQQSNVVRLILVRYKENYQNGGPLTGDLLLTPDYRSFYKPETKRQEYSILYDKTYVLTPQNKPTLQVKIHKRLGGAKICWETGTITNGPTSGHYYLLMISDQPASTAPLVDLTSIFYYTDN